MKIDFKQVLTGAAAALLGLFVWNVFIAPRLNRNGTMTTGT